MKKKFLAFILAAIMIIMLVPATAFAGEGDKTVGEILATVDGGFPTSSALGWINEHGAKAYKDSEILHVSSNIPLVENNLQKDSNNYIFVSGEARYTFVMTSEVLTKIIVENAIAFPPINPNGTYLPPHIHGEGDETIAFAAWDGSTEHNSMPTEAGNYYLTEDITLGSTWNVPTGVTNLCLNGHVIKMTGNKSVIRLGDGATLNLYDCGTSEHYFTVDDNGLWKLTDTKTEQTKTVTGGIITGDICDDNGGVVYVNSGVFTMTGGSIVGNTASKGGGVYVSDGVFTMNGGRITGNTAKYGGGVYVSDGVFTMSGGSIDHNTSKYTGGGVDFEDGAFTMSGGSIDHNMANKGGGVYAYESIALGGKAKITENTANDTTDNVWLYSDEFITLASAPDAPKIGMLVGVTTKNAPTATTPVAITTNGSQNDAHYFFADDSNYEVDFADDHLELKSLEGMEAKVVDYENKIETTYESLDSALTAAGSFDDVLLLKDITDRKDSITIPDFVFLDLNNHKFTMEDLTKVTNNGTIILYQKNENIIDGLLYAVSGAYAAGEDLNLYDNKITIPDGTFFTNDISTEGIRDQELNFVIFDDTRPLVWNYRVPVGVQLNVTYALNLGGNIESDPIQYAKPTVVTANFLTLSNDITIGSNLDEDCEACLAVESIHYEKGDPYYGEDVLGTFNANGHKITLNKTGKFICSSDVVFDDSVLVSGVDGLGVLKSTNYTDKMVTYYLGIPGSSGGSCNLYSIVTNTAKNGSFTVNKKSASSGSTVTITVKPDTGFTLETLTVVDKNGKEVEVENLGDNKFSFKMPKSKVTINATFMEDNSMLNFFVDVKANDYFYDAVLWAAENDITSGIDAIHFNPYGTTNRAQMITFLWRLAGSPVFEDDDIKFTDIKKSDYFYDAVVWGWNLGIVSGKTETVFAPYANVTRGEAVTFIYRYAKVAGGDLPNPFGDVKQGAFYYYPVLWAANNGITGGTSTTTFSPSAECTRAQVVTFLYRFNEKFN